MSKKDWLELFNENKNKMTALVSRFCPERKVHFESGIIEQRPKILGEILQKVWENIPDKPWIHEISGWEVLCDLCSEYIFDDCCEE